MWRVVAMLAIGQAALLAQQPPRTAADPSVFIDGVVLSTASPPQPLRGARLTVTQHGVAGAQAMSDGEGRFRVVVPASGTFRLAVTKAGFAPADIEIAAASSPPELVPVRLRQGAVVTGRVLDRWGLPAPSVGVRARRVADSNQPAPGPQAYVGETDDLGEYRIGSLAPGRYELSVERAPCETVRRGTAGIIPCDQAPVWREEPSAAPVVLELAEGESRHVEFLDESATHAPRSFRSSDPPGEGRITGRIVTGEGVPVAGALVTVGAAEGPAGAGSAVSDAAGRYAVEGLAAGRYRVRASRNGFFDGEHGRPRLQAITGVPVDLRDGQALGGVDVVLVRGQVIAGTILDAWGEPLEGVTVQAWEQSFTDGRPTITPASVARGRRTDDQGRYRLHGLRPGAYYVVAIDEPLVPDDDSPAAGGGVDRTAWQMDQMQAQLQRTREARNLAHVFYPGRTSSADAWPVRLEGGGGASGIDMVFEALRGVRVHGVLFDAAGRPLGAQDGPGSVLLSLVQRVPPGAPVMPPRPALHGPDGAFEFQNVLPGEYVIHARRIEVTVGPAAVSVPTTIREFVAQPVIVGDGDVGPIAVRTSAGSRLEGRVVLEGAPSPIAPPAFNLWTLPEDPDLAVPAGRVRILEDWSFEVEGLTGPVRFGLRSAPPGWWLRAVEIDGLNAAEHAITLGAGAGSRRDVRVVLSNTAPVVAGRALDERGAAVSGAAVLVFPVDAARWQGWPYHRRLVRPDVNGRFVIDTLPPGEYWLIATSGLDDRIESGEWQTQALLASLVSRARRVTMGEGQQQTVDLRVVAMQ
jgi:hypothetical protein